MNFSSFFSGIAESFYDNFIYDKRWMFIVTGLKNTLTITVFALVIGLILGFLVAYVRATNQNTGTLKFPNWLCKVYVSIIRGTPVLVQLMIINYIIFSSVDISKIIVAIIAFGINSGAYVSEIFRAGITSVDKGQMEAGRSLGLSYRQTMWRIVMPQALKNILPSLINEFISLLKETSVSGYIAIQDLTKGGDIITGLTYDAIMPLLTVALIYFACVRMLEFFAAKLERRLAKSDRG